MGKKACVHILLGTYPGLASLVHVSVFLPCDFHVSDIFILLPNLKKKIKEEKEINSLSMLHRLLMYVHKRTWINCAHTSHKPWLFY